MNKKNHPTFELPCCVAGCKKVATVEIQGNTLVVKGKFRFNFEHVMAWVMCEKCKETGTKQLTIRKRG